MANLTNLKLTLTSDRKLIAIECDEFRIKLNGVGNSDYISVLKPLGIVLEFKNEKAPVDDSRPIMSAKDYDELRDDDKFLYRRGE